MTLYLTFFPSRGTGINPEILKRETVTNLNFVKNSGFEAKMQLNNAFIRNVLP